MKSQEKRRHTRYPVGLTMDVHSAGAAPLRATISDLSESGMSLRSSAVLEAGMCLHLTLRAPRPLHIRGEVRHIKGSVAGGMHRYGVRFHKVGYSGSTFAS